MDKTLRSKAVNYGLYMGLTLTLITVLIYAFDLSLFTSLWLMLGNLIIILVFGVLSGASAKKIMGGYPSFKQVFTSYTITMAVGLLISTLVGMLLFNVVDPEAAEVVKELSIESTEAMMKRFGAPEAQIEEAITAAEEQDPFSIGTQVKNYFGFLAFMLVIGLLVALIMKKKDPNSVKQ